MDLTTILSLVTFAVAFILGLIAKKVDWVNNKLIPLQNLAVGIIIAIIEWIITKDFSTAIALSGLVAGGYYDIIHNLDKIINNK